MLLEDLLSGVVIRGDPPPALHIKRISHFVEDDSDVVFKCRYHGLHYPPSLSNASAHLVVDADDPEASDWKGKNVTRVEQINKAYAIACRRLYGSPVSELILVAVTGTKGKTTTCHLIAQALENRGYRAAFLTSLAQVLPNQRIAAKNTTPDPRTIQSFLHLASLQACTHVVVEASSIGLAEERLHGLRFDVVVFTNFGSDHIEYHGGRDQYLQQKLRLFEDVDFHTPSTIAVVNVDDAVGESVARHSRVPVVSFGLRRGDHVPQSVSWTATESTVILNGHRLVTPFVGEHNAYNVAAASAVATVLGVANEKMFSGLSGLPGRLERVPSALPITIYVDYAHTPESVSAVLRCVKDLHRYERLVAVLGCSGNSDHQKRPRMTQAASEIADMTILTSDNPGHEHPTSIIRDMLGGARGASKTVEAIVERWAAIEHALESARPNGVVVILGKGSETYQLIGDRRIPYSDVAVAAEVANRMARRLQDAGEGRRL